MSDRRPSDFIPLTPLTFHILAALARGKNHGYGLMKEIRERTDGALDPATGTVYLALQRLEDDGLILDAARERRKRGDTRRRYYRLSPLGLRVAKAEAERLAGLVELAVEADLLNG
jgi:DNA-binding PadR family transcriptional regulator